MHVSDITTHPFLYSITVLTYPGNSRFCSCLPTATTQVYLTQVYSAEGDAQHLSAFLIPQYILMFISMVALTAYTLNLIF